MDWHALSSLTAFGSSYYLLLKRLNIFFVLTNLLENILAALPQNLMLYSTCFVYMIFCDGRFEA